MCSEMLKVYAKCFCVLVLTDCSPIRISDFSVRLLDLSMREGTWAFSNVPVASIVIPKTS